MKFTEEDRYQISGRGLVITTKLPRTFTDGEVRLICGSLVDIDGKTWRCVGVERWAVGWDVWPEGTPIGLLVREPREDL